MKPKWRAATADDRVRFRLDKHGYVRAIFYLEHGSTRCVGPLGAVVEPKEHMGPKAVEEVIVEIVKAGY